MKITNHVDIHATPAEVFYWLEDPDRAMQWMTSVKRAEILQESPDRVGTTFREYVQEDGHGTELHGVITEFIQNERFAVRVEGDHTVAQVVFILAEMGAMTRLTQQVELRFKGLLKLSGVFFRSSIKKKIIGQSQKEFSNLKKLCESD